MTTRRAILLCENPRSAHWRLEPPLSGRFVLLGWRHSREDEIEGGVPDDVASLLARSLTRVALVTFPSGGSEPVAFTSEDHVRTLRPTRWRDRLRVIVSYSPLAFGGRLHFRFLLVSSRRPDVVKTLFDGVSWSMQAQAIFLSAPDAPAPTIDWRTFMSLQRRAIDRDALVGTWWVVPVDRHGAPHPASFPSHCNGHCELPESRCQEVSGARAKAIDNC